MSGQTEEGRLLEMVAQITRAAGRRIRADQVEVGEERVRLLWHGKVTAELSRENWDLLKVEAEQGLEAARAQGAAKAANKRPPKTSRASTDPTRCPSCAGKSYSPRPVDLGQLCSDLFHAPTPKEGDLQ